MWYVSVVSSFVSQKLRPWIKYRFFYLDEFVHFYIPLYANLTDVQTIWFWFWKWLDSVLIELLMKNIWKAMQYTNEWEVHGLIVKVEIVLSEYLVIRLSWPGGVPWWLEWFWWSPWGEVLHESSSWDSARNTTTSHSFLRDKAFQSADQETRPAATIWLDKIIYSAVSLALERGTTVQPLGCVHARTDGWKDICTSQNSWNKKYFTVVVIYTR